MVDTLVRLKAKIDLAGFLSFFIKCLIQNSNYEEIVSNIGYITLQQLPLLEESTSQILMCLIDYDDWTSFKKYFQIFFDAALIGEHTLKKVISALVEKSSLEVLRFVVTVTMREKNSFMKLKLTENQYKCIILSLVKSNLSLSGKIIAQPGPAIDLDKQKSVENKDSDHFEVLKSPQNFEVIKSEHESSDEFFEIIDEEMLNKIIEDIVSSEKKSK